MALRLPLGLWLLAFSIALRAQAAPSFSLPVDCEVGKTCIVQNYVDQDPGPEARDYRCGFLAYDGHRGTDLRVLDPAASRKGVAVLAAAPGRVRALRDGMRDVSVREIGRASLGGKDAGNSVVVDHGDGWESQYAHLRMGSVAVSHGETVKRGQVLGMVGLSGNTEFAHLHFEVRHRGKPVDPFVGSTAAEPCKAGSEALWDAPTLAALGYLPTGVLAAGLGSTPPKLVNNDVDPETAGMPARSSPAVVLWVQVYGVQGGDVEEMRVAGPDGTQLAQRRRVFERNAAQSLGIVGSRRHAGAWPTGRYRGEYVLQRGNERVLTLSREVVVD